MSDQNVKELERQRPGKIGKAVPTDNYNESRSDDRSVHNAPHGMQVVQVETLGKHGVLLLFLCATVAAISAVGFLFTLYELKTVSAKYEVLQYDQQAMKAQLVAKGIYQGTEH